MAAFQRHSRTDTHSPCCSPSRSHSHCLAGSRSLFLRSKSSRSCVPDISPWRDRIFFHLGLNLRLFIATHAGLGCTMLQALYAIYL